MDHNLDDSLNLESDIVSMDFDHSGVVVNQEDITLETTVHDGDIPMELENIELQPTLMDTGNEEIIVSDFMSEQFTLQEYNAQDFTSKGAPEVTDTVDASHLNILTSHSDSVMDLKFDADTIAQSVTHDVTLQPKYIQVKAAVAPTRSIKKESLVASTMPRQVAIAPKPPALTSTVMNKPFVSGNKQYAIAPKPVTLVANKSLMKMALSGQSSSKTGNAVLTQIGKQLVMMPTSGGQKLKLVTSSGSAVSNMKYAQLISTKSGGTSVQKPVVGKIIVQGQTNTEDTAQQTLITKLVSGASTAPAARYVMQQKTVPITIGGTKVLMASPTKQGIELKRGIKFKKPIISLQSSAPKSVIPVTSQGATTTKKVVIKSNSQNVILKTTAPPKTPQVSKEGTVIMQGQKSQLHQINVPGKGIQYIRLITNPTPAPQKPTKAQTPVSFVLGDNKVTTKPQKKLVRIAPVAAKVAPTVTQQTRSSQSLLAPLSPVEVSVEHLETTSDLGEKSVELEEAVVCEEYGESDAETKSALRALLGETEDTEHHLTFNTMQEVEVEFETKSMPVQEDSNSMMDMLEANRSEDHPLIVIPSNYSKQSQMCVNSDSMIFTNESKDYPNIQVDVEGESVSMPYISPQNAQSLPENESNVATAEIDSRPRKACNCTKSQCLKLYCDCFANGEFCNQCNCNNCHNNLENESLRQKAIRACLDRNPNAFRPKIGKSKTGGPEIIRRHNKGCNCKRSGCLKNYCECYEAKIACTSMCKCVGCRNVEETLERRRDALRLRDKLTDPMFRPPPAGQVSKQPVRIKQPCSFMTSEVIDAVCQCLIAAAVESTSGHQEVDEDDEDGNVCKQETDPMRDVIEEFARCLQDIINTSHQSSSVPVFNEGKS